MPPSVLKSMSSIRAGGPMDMNQGESRKAYKITNRSNSFQASEGIDDKYQQRCFATCAMQIISMIAC